MILNLALWLAAPLLQTVLALIMVVRGAWRSFAFFFAYTVFSIAATGGRFLVRNNGFHYYYVYWATESLYAVLGFLAIYEVFKFVFRNFYSLWWFRFLLPAISVIMLTVSILIPVTRPPVQSPLPLAVIFSLEILVRCLQVGVFFLIFLLARIFNLYYRQYAFGIAAGFGISAIGVLATVVIRSGFGTGHIKILTLIPGLAYDVAVLVWLASFVRSESTEPFRDFQHLFTPELFLQRLQNYRERMKRVLRP